MTDAVVDANVALKWVLPEQDSDIARTLRDLTLVAPDFWLVECGNVLWVHVHRRKLPLSDARAMLEHLRSAPIAAIPSGEVIDAALAIAADLDESLYDCLYLALAVKLDVRLITADRAFVRKATRRAPYANRIVALDSLR